MRCKFKLITMSDHYGGSLGLKFQAVGGGSAENKAFFAATPNGTLELHTVNKAACEGLQLGGEYYLDISAAPKSE